MSRISSSCSSMSQSQLCSRILIEALRKDKALCSTQAVAESFRVLLALHAPTSSIVRYDALEIESFHQQTHVLLVWYLDSIQALLQLIQQVDRLGGAFELMQNAGQNEAFAICPPAVRALML